MVTTTGAVDRSQRNAATTAALACLLSFAVVVSVNFGIFARLIVSGDPALTARNIQAHETLYRVGIAGDLLYCIAVLVLSAALYVVLKPVDQHLALIATLGRLTHGLTWLLVTINLFTALRLLSRPEYALALSPEQWPALSRVFLSGFDQYYVGLLFWSLGGTVGAYLWLKSAYIPRALSTFGIAASAWCVVCTFTLFLFPGFPRIVNLWWFDTPMVLFEIVLSFQLLFRGLRPAPRG